MPVTDVSDWIPPDMSEWTSQVVRRFQALLDKDAPAPSEASADEPAADPGDEEAAALRRVAKARDAEMSTVPGVHATLTRLAFSGYEQWCQEADEDWITNCLEQVLSDDQSTYLVTVLKQASTEDLRAALRTMALAYTQAWVQAAAREAGTGQGGVSAAGLRAFRNDASWNYSRTPGTRYYISADGEYFYSDNPDAPRAGWLTSTQREDSAARLAKPWKDTGWWYTPTGHDDPAYVFGKTDYGPWLTQQAAEAALHGAAALQGTPNDPNWQASRTPGTRYYIHHGDGHLYSDEPSGPPGIWKTLRQREDDAKAKATPWGQHSGAAYTPTGKPDMYRDDYVYRASADGPWLTREAAETALSVRHPTADDAGPAPAEPQAGNLLAAVRSAVSTMLEQQVTSIAAASALPADQLRADAGEKALEAAMAKLASLLEGRVRP